MKLSVYSKRSIDPNDDRVYLNGTPAITKRNVGVMEYFNPSYPAPAVHAPLPQRHPHTLPKDFGPLNAVIKSAAPAEPGVIVTEGLNGIPTRRRPGKLKTAAQFETERQRKAQMDRING
jgi:hypothetical protein